MFSIANCHHPVLSPIENSVSSGITIDLRPSDIRCESVEEFDKSYVWEKVAWERVHGKELRLAVKVTTQSKSIQAYRFQITKLILFCSNAQVRIKSNPISSWVR